MAQLRLQLAAMLLNKLLSCKSRRRWAGVLLTRLRESGLPMLLPV